MATPDPNDANSFEKQASKPAESFTSEFWGYLKNNKKWWLTPIIIVLALLGLVVVLAGTGAAPFIYTLF